jgi:hypothetical protein
MSGLWASVHRNSFAFFPCVPSLISLQCFNSNARSFATSTQHHLSVSLEKNTHFLPDAEGRGPHPLQDPWLELANVRWHNLDDLCLVSGQSPYRHAPQGHELWEDPGGVNYHFSADSESSPARHILAPSQWLERIQRMQYGLCGFSSWRGPVIPTIAKHASLPHLLPQEASEGPDHLPSLLAICDQTELPEPGLLATHTHLRKDLLIL